MTNTPNIGLFYPANGADIGNWDSQVANPNYVELDLCIGGIATISLNNSNVVLNATQMQSRMIVFNSTLTGSVVITFATSFVKDYEIWHQCTGSSAFTITLETTATGQVICAPPGEIVSVFNDGANLNYKNFGRIGEYWDYGGSSLPNWVQGCSPKQPYLNCDGSMIPAAYTILPGILGSSLLPNTQGKYPVYLNQSASTPISSGTNGMFTASSVGVIGGVQATTLSSRHLPQLVDPGHFHSLPINLLQQTPAVEQYGTGSPDAAPISVNTGSATTGITYGSSTQIVVPSLPPTFVSGLRLIRAA